jgi:hypothetical protein
MLFERHKTEGHLNFRLAIPQFKEDVDWTPEIDV